MTANKYGIITVTFNLLFCTAVAALSVFYIYIPRSLPVVLYSLIKLQVPAGFVTVFVKKEYGYLPCRGCYVHSFDKPPAIQNKNAFIHYTNSQTVKDSQIVLTQTKKKINKKISKLFL